MENIEIGSGFLNRLDITFSFPLNGALWQTVYDELDRLPGVEEVHLRRYSAFIVFAPHVVTDAELQHAIVEAFNELTLNNALYAVFPNGYEVIVDQIDAVDEV